MARGSCGPESDVRAAAGRPRVVDAAPFHHPFREVVLGLDEVLPQVPLLQFLVRVVPEVDVLAPVVFQDALPSPRVILAPDLGSTRVQNG